MALKIKPPTHSIDQVGTWIHPLDPAWDKDRLKAEEKVLLEKALSELQEKAIATYRDQHGGRELTEAEIEEVKASVVMTEEEQREAASTHPWARYGAGKTRFQPDAPDWDHEGKPVTARDYLKDAPTEFIIRRIPWSKCREIEAISWKTLHHRWAEYVRAGLKAIKSPDFDWRIEKGSDGVPNEILQALHDSDTNLINALGIAIAAYNRPLDDDEGKR